MKEITKLEMIQMYWQGLRLKPRRMIGNSGKCNWVVASSHPTYSITWTWALYWTHPKCWKFKYYDHTKERKVLDLENERFDESEIKGWIEVPKVKR